MNTDTQIRNKLLRKINRIPADKLKELDDFVSKLEHDTIQKPRTLSFAGSWKDIDDILFQNLTIDLIANRQKNRRLWSPITRVISEGSPT